MSGIQPPHRNYPSQNVEQSQQAAEIRRMKEEVDIQAVSTFFATVNAENAPQSGNQSDKLKQLEKEMKQGEIDPAELMLSIVSNSIDSQTLGLPKISELSTPKSQLLLHIEMLSLVANEKVKSDITMQPILKQIVMLADQLAGDRIPIKDAMNTFANLIVQVNEKLPRSQRYPSEISASLLGF